MVNDCIYLATLVSVASLYFMPLPGIHPFSHNHSYTGGSEHLLIRSGKHSHMHSNVDDTTLEIIWGSVFSSNGFPPLNCRAGDWTYDPPITEWLLYKLWAMRNHMGHFRLTLLLYWRTTLGCACRWSIDFNMPETWQLMLINSFFDTVNTVCVNSLGLEGINGCVCKI